MGQSDRFDPDATPPFVPRTPGEPEPLHIREATPPVTPAADVEPTAVLPRQPVAPVQPTAVAARVPADPLYPDPLYADPRYVAATRRREAWPYVLAVLALLLGGLAGFLIGAALDGDDETIRTADPPTSTPEGSDIDATLDMLLARTRTDGEFRTPSGFPQLDEIASIDRAAAIAPLEQQIATLEAADGDVAALSQQVAALETALGEVTAERDQLATQLAESGDTDGEMQSQLDAANARITTLEADLTTARADLDTATADLRTARTELDAARAELDALAVVVLPNYVDGDIAKARSDAAANGWTLIEETAEAGAAPGTVLEQVPAANANMVRGSVLYVTVAGNV